MRGACVLSSIIPQPEAVLKRLFVLAAILVGAGSLALGQQAPDAQTLARLKMLFPTAASFSPKEGEPPHFKALGPGARGSEPVIGYAFWTTEAVPLERGYGGPIPILGPVTPVSGFRLKDGRASYGVGLETFALQYITDHKK